MRRGVILAASGESWEGPALEVLQAARIPVVKRCVDLNDLLATTAAGVGAVAVVSDRLRGLDADAVVRLLRDDVRPISVGSSDLAKIGISVGISPQSLQELPEVVARVEQGEMVQDPFEVPGDVLVDKGHQGRVIAVHGPQGAPGRTSIAINLACLHARTTPTVLIDADPYLGTVAQHLGILDETSGLLAASRLVNTGTLDAASFVRCRRHLSDNLDVVTGLPRADRWIEVRSGAIESILEHSRALGDVVIDTGFSLEDAADFGQTTARNQMTLDAVRGADEVVLVGTAEPVGLARLARTLVATVAETAAPLHVVINRMRESLGWNGKELSAFVEDYVDPASITFLPLDLATADKSVVSGRSWVELGEGSKVVNALAALEAHLEKSKTLLGR